VQKVPPPKYRRHTTRERPRKDKKPDTDENDTDWYIGKDNQDNKTPSSPRNKQDDKGKAKLDDVSGDIAEKKRRNAIAIDLSTVPSVQSKDGQPTEPWKLDLKLYRPDDTAIRTSSEMQRQGKISVRKKKSRSFEGGGTPKNGSMIEETPLELVSVFELLNTGDEEKQLEGLERAEKLIERLPVNQFAAVIPYLVNLLEYGGVPVELRTLKALRKLVGTSDPLKKVFSESGGLRNVLALLSHSSQEVQDVAGSSLGYVTSMDTQDAFCEAGAVKTLLQRLQEAKSVKTLGILNAALYSLTQTSDRARGEVRTFNGLPVLFKIIKEGLEKKDAEREEFEFINEQAVGILRNMCIKNAENQQAIREQGGFPLLKVLLTNKNPMLQVIVLSTLESRADRFCTGRSMHGGTICNRRE
jgi:hypothetical protein